MQFWAVSEHYFCIRVLELHKRSPYSTTRLLPEDTFHLQRCHVRAVMFVLVPAEWQEHAAVESAAGAFCCLEMSRTASAFSRESLVLADTELVDFNQQHPLLVLL